jgi:mRNA interferase MazF
MVKRGEIYLFNFDQQTGASMIKTRPVLIVQNDVANDRSPNTIVVAIRGDKDKRLPVHVKLPKGQGNLDKDSLVDCGHMMTVMQGELGPKLGKISNNYFELVDRALKVSLAL